MSSDVSQENIGSRSPDDVCRYCGGDGWIKWDIETAEPCDVCRTPWRVQHNPNGWSIYAGSRKIIWLGHGPENEAFAYRIVQACNRPVDVAR